MAITPRTRPPLMDQRMPPSPEPTPPPPESLPPPSSPTPLWKKWFIAPLLASVALLAFIVAHLGTHGDSFHKHLPQDTTQGAVSFTVHKTNSTEPSSEAAGIHKIPKIEEDEGNRISPDRCLLHAGQKDEFKEFRDNICTAEYTRVTRKDNYSDMQVSFLQRRYNKRRHVTTYKYKVCVGAGHGNNERLIDYITFGDRGTCCLLSTKYHGTTFLESKVRVGIDKKTCTYGAQFVEPLKTNDDGKARCEVYEMTYLGFVPKFHVRAAVHPHGDRYFAQRVTGAYCEGNKWRGFDKVPGVDYVVDWEYSDEDPNVYIDDKIYDGPGAGEEGGEAPWSTTGDDQMEPNADSAGSNPGGAGPTGGDSTPQNDGSGNGSQAGTPGHVEEEKKDWELELEKGNIDPAFLDKDRMQDLSGAVPQDGSMPVDETGSYDETVSIDEVPDDPLIVEVEEEPVDTTPIIVQDNSGRPPVIVTDDRTDGRPVVFVGDKNNLPNRPIVVGGGGGGTRPQRPIIAGGGVGGGGSRPHGGNRPVVVVGDGVPTTTYFDPQDHGFRYESECNPITDIPHKASFGQDEAIYEIYFTNPYRCGGTVVEVGRSDGVTSSSSYFFEFALNWKAVNIVANPDTFGELEGNRPHSTNVNGAFCQGASTISYKDDKFYLPPGNTAQSVSEKYETGIVPSGAEGVECVSLADVFRESSVEHVDVMYISSEGNVISVLKTMNWGVRVLIWVIEMDPQSPDYGEAVDLLRENNYVRAEWDIMRWCDTPSQCMLNEVWLQKGYNPQRSRRRLEAVSRRLRSVEKHR